MILVFVGLFGATVAVSGLWAPLPSNPQGTCGPGLGSEAAIEALVNPGSIGAGAEPPASNHTARAQWNQFVNDCQTATNHRVLITVPMLVVSVVLAVVGLLLLWKRLGRREDREPAAFDPRPATPATPATIDERPLSPSAPFPAAAGPPGPPGAPISL